MESNRRAEVAMFFVEENLVEGEPRVVMSPSGRFELRIRTYRTAPGRWSYTRGTVTRISDGTEVCDIQRNFSTFHHSFVTKDGRELLITGRSYMSQTIVDLDRGLQYEPPGEHYDGRAFCWSRCYLSPDGNTLAVDGCFWACPYEFRFFDFSDPSQGWAPLPLVGAESVENPSDKREPQWTDAGAVDCFQSDGESEPHERTRVERRGTEMVVVEHWLSQHELARRESEARTEAENDAWWQNFRTTDAMYLRLVALIADHRLPGDVPESASGRQLKLWLRRKEPRVSADLEWNIEARTLSVRLYSSTGEAEPVVSFEPTIEGIEQAIAFIVQRSG